MTVGDLNSPDRRVRERAYASLRRDGLLHTNKGAVTASLASGGLFVPGVEVDHYDQVMFAELVGASAVSGNPGPVLAYLQTMLTETGERVARTLPGEVGQRVRQELPGYVIRALDQAARGRGAVRVPVPNAQLDVGLATYRNWVDLVYDEPRLVPTQQVLGVQLYEVRTEHRQRRIDAPNTFQPYVVLRGLVGAGGR